MNKLIETGMRLKQLIDFAERCPDLWQIIKNEHQEEIDDLRELLETKE